MISSASVIPVECCRLWSYSDVQCELSVQSRGVHMTPARRTAHLYNIIQYCMNVAVGNIGRIVRHNVLHRTVHTLHTLHITLCSAICSPTAMIMPLKGVTINHNGDTQGSAWNAHTQVPSHLNGSRWGVYHSVPLLPCGFPPQRGCAGR